MNKAKAQPGKIEWEEIEIQTGALNNYEEIINVDLYEDVDLARHHLNSAFISGTDPFTLSLAPTSSLLVAAGELVFIKFILTNRAPAVTKFFLDSGVGGVVTDNGVRGNGVERQTDG